ncbi:hypothetical protein H5T51_01050 [Candidatus Bathyarchaeota archaeon]|nr:hypothetical protein [Candidatus Bathyarchaeota archaeon]
MDEDKSERKVFFPVFLFIGMGIGFLLIDFLGGLGFVASMFIGMGVGILFDNLVKPEGGKVSFEPPVQAGGIAAIVIGALFIAGGVSTILMPGLLETLAPYLIGLGLIAIGIIILVYGAGMLKAKTVPAEEG